MLIDAKAGEILLLCAEARQFVTSPTWQSLGVSVYREHLLG